MKKMIISAFVLTMFATTQTTFAQTTTTPTPVAAVKDADGEKTKVDPASLPDAVKATLAMDTYKDWKVSNAWAVKSDPVYYEIELKKEDKTNTVKLTSDGKVK